MVNALEASHMMLSDEVVKKNWFIRNPEIEEILKDIEIKYSLDIVPNTWSKYGRRINYSAATSKGAISSHMQIMIGNCGAAVWYGIDYLNDYTFPISEFIARNIASYSGTNVIIATGNSKSGERMKKLGWEVPISGHSSSRWEKEMAYGMLYIPNEQMAKTGYNHCYSTTK